MMLSRLPPGGLLVQSHSPGEWVAVVSLAVAGPSIRQEGVSLAR